MKRQIFSIIIVPLLGILIWNCAKERPGSLSEHQKKQLALLPESAIALAYCNVEKFSKSEMRQAFKHSMFEKCFENEEYQDFITATEFDPRRDVEEIYLEILPNGKKTEKSLLAVLLGKFNKEKILTYIQERYREGEIVSEKYQGFDLYFSEHKKMALSFPNEQTLIFGKKPFVKEWLENYQSGRKTSNHELLDQIKKLKYKNGFWFTMRADKLYQEIMEQIEDHPQTKNLEALKSVQKVYFSMDANEMLYFDGTGEFSDKEKAQLFHDAIKGFLATIKLSISGERETIDIINKIKVKTRDKRIKITFTMSQEDFEKLMTGHRKIARY